MVDTSVQGKGETGEREVQGYEGLSTKEIPCDAVDAAERKQKGEGSSVRVGEVEAQVGSRRTLSLCWQVKRGRRFG